MQPGKKVWLVPCDISADVQRVELPGVCVIGTTGLGYESATRLARQALTRAGGQAKFAVKASGIDLLVGGQSYVMVEFGEVERWHWRRMFVPLEGYRCARALPRADSGIREREDSGGGTTDEVRSGKPHAARAGSDRIGMAGG